MGHNIGDKDCMYNAIWVIIISEIRIACTMAYNIGDKDCMYNAIWVIIISEIRMACTMAYGSFLNTGLETQVKHWKSNTIYAQEILGVFLRSPHKYEETRLQHAFVEVTPIFTRLTDDKLLNRCLYRETYNHNEAASHLLWSKCLKTKFCGRQKILIAVSESVGEFNPFFFVCLFFVYAFFLSRDDDNLCRVN